EGGTHADLRLAEADVAADEPVHRTRRLEILLHGLDRGLLVRRLPVREVGLQPFEQLVREVVRDSWRALPLCIEREQLARQLADARPRPVLQQLPGLAAELRERGRLRVG